MKREPILHPASPGFRRAIPMAFFLTLAAMAAILILNAALKSPGGTDFGLGGFSKMEEGWTTASGESFEVARIDELRTQDADHVSIFYRLPAAMDQDESIVFRSKNCYVTVLLDGETVYATDVADAPFYNHSPGTRWNIVNIASADAGKTVELQVRQAYQDGRAKVDNFYHGDSTAIALHQIGAKAWGFVISLLIFFVALVFLSTWIVLNWRRAEKDHSLLWLSLFSMIAACWCLLETNLFQFFSEHLRLIQVADNMMLVLGGLPLYLYLDSVYHVFRSRVIRVLCALDAIYVLGATLLQILGIWDYHQTLNGAIGTYGIAVSLLIVCLIRRGRSGLAFAAKSDKLFFYLQQAGVLLLGLGLLGDLARYLTSDVLDRAFIIRIGLLAFIICFGASNIYHMIQLVKRGMESDFISQLAYVDGLTRVGNRTAYTEQMQRLVSANADDPLALVMFDINNLKMVNDTLGHKAGDELIVHCARILTGTFTEGWSVYRIGGDEFVAVTWGGDVRAAYLAAAQRLERAIIQCNSLESLDYTVAIAHGVGFSQRITAQAVEQAEKEADARMYQNKFELKR